MHGVTNETLMNSTDELRDERTKVLLMSNDDTCPDFITTIGRPTRVFVLFCFVLFILFCFVLFCFVFLFFFCGFCLFVCLVGWLVFLFCFFFLFCFVFFSLMFMGCLLHVHFLAGYTLTNHQSF